MCVLWGLQKESERERERERERDCLSSTLKTAPFSLLTFA